MARRGLAAVIIKKKIIYAIGNRVEQTLYLV